MLKAEEENVSERLDCHIKSMFSWLIEVLMRHTKQELRHVINGAYDEKTLVLLDNHLTITFK